MKDYPCLISVSDSAEMLGLSEQRVRELCRSGDLKSQKIGSNWVIEKGVVSSYGVKNGNILAEDHQAYLAFESVSKNKPIALSFFSGALGLDLGLEKAGFDIRLTCEVDKFCRQTISLNRPNTALLGSILDHTAATVRASAQLDNHEEIDLVVGGPPCQAFSTAGKRQGLNDERGNVFLHYVDLAIDLKPKFIVIENVRGLLSCPLVHLPHSERERGVKELKDAEKPGGALYSILTKLMDAGYSYSFNLYNAANFGTPQSRERVIIVCSRDGSKPPFLIPTHSQDRSHGLQAWRTFRQAVKGLRPTPALTFPEKRLQYYRLLKSGENWRSLPVDLQREALGKSFYSGGGKTGFLRRLAWDKPSPTVVTHPAMPATDLAHPDEDRPLSIGEYMRIQQFPDDWILAGNLVQQYKQIGNAVPIGLGHAIGVLLRKLIEGKKVESPEDFKYSRYRGADHESWLEKHSDFSNCKLPLQSVQTG